MGGSPRPFLSATVYPEDADGPARKLGRQSKARPASCVTRKARMRCLMAHSTRRPAGRQSGPLTLVVNNVWHRPGPRAGQDFAKALAAVPTAWDVLAREEQPSVRRVRSVLHLAKELQRPSRRLLCALLCCTAFLTSCGPTIPSPSTVLALPATPNSAVFRKTTEGGEPRWYIDLTWTPPPRMNISAATQWFVIFSERQVSPTPSDFTRIGYPTMGETIRREQKSGRHTHSIPMGETWWGTTRDFHARIRITDKYGGDRMGPVPIPATLTFPPMPPEFVLLKMHGKLDAVCQTFPNLTQAACIRQQYRWDTGMCIKTVTIEEIVTTIAQHPDWTADEVKRYHGTYDSTRCYSTFFHDRDEFACLQRGGEWTRWDPTGEDLHFPACRTELRMSDVLEVFLDGEQP